MKTDDVIRIDGGEADLVVVAWYRVVIGASPSLVTYRPTLHHVCL